LHGTSATRISITFGESIMALRLSFDIVCLGGAFALISAALLGLF
jgi:hypothetical protein